MAAAITTTGVDTTGGKVETVRNPGEPDKAFVERHFNSVEGHGVVGGSTPLETTYPSGGSNVVVTTTQGTGESDELFLMRHQLKVAMTMLEDPLDE